MVFLTNLERVEAEKLAGVTLGEPAATTKKTVEELVAADIVGVYGNPPAPGVHTSYLGLENPRA